ncbi:MAG: hypothetical protein JJE49_10480, partial [Peptostreptococcaceae bacterium]|nr:hypothetical protein [Peptostreptococcaceae bacterium]
MYKILLFAVIALGFNSCSEKPKQDDGIKYYRQIQFSETPFDIEKGTHPLTAEEAKTINNYKFTTNENKQLVSVEYNRNDTLLGYS